MPQGWKVPFQCNFFVLSYWQRLDLNPHGNYVSLQRVTIWYHLGLCSVVDNMKYCFTTKNTPVVKSKELTGSHEYVDIFILIYLNNLCSMFTLFALLIKIWKKINVTGLKRVFLPNFLPNNVFPKIILEGFLSDEITSSCYKMQTYPTKDHSFSTMNKLFCCSKTI